MITVIDYGMANIGSVVNMLKRIGQESIVSVNPDEIARSEKLILPGVGAFDGAVNKLERLGLRDALNEAALNRRIPILGICLGMQLLLQGSEEGEKQGFGWISGWNRRFQFPECENPLKVPHMGWNKVRAVRPSPYFSADYGEQRFYFVHSYHAVCDSAEDVLAVADYGGEFAASIHRENIVGVQFHPEKSHRFGMKLLSAFAEL